MQRAQRNLCFLVIIVVITQNDFLISAIKTLQLDSSCQFGCESATSFVGVWLIDSIRPMSWSGLGIWFFFFKPSLLFRFFNPLRFFFSQNILYCDATSCRQRFEFSCMHQWWANGQNGFQFVQNVASSGYELTMIEIKVVFEWWGFREVFTVRKGLEYLKIKKRCCKYYGISVC